MVPGERDHHVTQDDDKSSCNQDKIRGQSKSLADGRLMVNEEKKTSDIVIGIDGNSGGSASDEDIEVCRICHFGTEDSTELGHGSELIPLGCDCKGQLGLAHRNCAETWFGRRGNRLCEICGNTAKNTRTTNVQDTSIFMMEWSDIRAIASTIDTAEERSRRCKRTCYNLVLACLVIAFVLPWFLRVDIL